MTFELKLPLPEQTKNINELVQTILKFIKYIYDTLQSFHRNQRIVKFIDVYMIENPYLLVNG